MLYAFSSLIAHIEDSEGFAFDFTVASVAKELVVLIFL